MKRFVFLEKAQADLDSIADYYGAIDEEIADRVLRDIKNTIGKLADFPDRGEAVPGRALRRILSARYRFKIFYRPIGQTIQIVGIFRYQNRDF